MAQSSDELIKREIIEAVKDVDSGLKLRIFPQSSNQDQLNFGDGGLTFGVDGVLYGSCDAVWYLDSYWVDKYDGRKLSKKPAVALEGTDALSRGSSGNAQYQRFHHALGAVRNGLLGIYYFRPGNSKIQEDLFGMAFNASQIELGNYLIIDNLNLLRELLATFGTEKHNEIVSQVLNIMQKKYQEAFYAKYQGDWNIFAKKRSSFISSDFVIKHAARNLLNFTDSSQRAGHIAVGEMYLTKYLVNKSKFYYLFPRMTNSDIKILDNGKKTDKEWFLLRNEPGVEILTRDQIQGASPSFLNTMEEIQNKPLKGKYVSQYQQAMKECMTMLRKDKWRIEKEGFHGKT